MAITTPWRGCQRVNQALTHRARFRFGGGAQPLHLRAGGADLDVPHPRPNAFYANAWPGPAMDCLTKPARYARGIPRIFAGNAAIDRLAT